MMRPIRSVTNNDAYARLVELSAELEHMADCIWSVAGETALRTAARFVRALASGFFLTLSDGVEPIVEPPTRLKKPRRKDEA